MESQFDNECAAKTSRTSKNNGNQAMCPLCKIPIIKENLIEIPDSLVDAEESFNFNLPMFHDTKATKIEALLNDLSSVRASNLLNKDPLTKSVVFSQFTTMLTFCQEPLKKAGFKYVRLDGTMNRNQRSLALDSFKSDPEVTIFLISIKSGGVGLNLVSACRVYLLEPYWNPAVEQQAVDRVHRLGQTRPVTTIRFIIKNSVEENMQKRQKYKTALAQKALEEEDGDVDGDGRRRKRSRVQAIAEKQSILLEKVESIAILFK